MENKNDFNFDMFEQGKRLETERPNAEQKEKKKQEKRKKEKRLNIAAGVIIALIAAAALVLAAPIFFAKYNPERLAKQYVEAVINKDYGSVYDKSEGKRFADFGRDEFVAACEANPELIKICSGEVKDFRVEKYGAPDGDFQNMLVTCVCTSEDGAGEVAEQYIFPVQMINNGFWKYDEYAAVITFDIICRAKIYAPRQTTVSINGEQLADTACEVKTASAADGGSFTYLEYSVEPMLAGTYTVSVGTAELSDGALQLANGTGELSSGAAQLSEGTNKLADGSKKLDDGAKTLNTGMRKFRREGINKILNAYNDDITPLLDRLDALGELGRNYNNFSGAAKGVDGEVKFIYEAAAVTAEKKSE